jgi:oxalate---CoA ligase
VDTFQEMGLVKVLKTAIVDGNRKHSLQQPITIVYLPEKSQDEINAFTAGVNKPYKQAHIPSSTRSVLDGVDYSKAHRKKGDKGRDDKLLF